MDINRCKKNNNLNYQGNIKDLIDIGKCIKMIDCKKSYQVIGINQNKDICWVREWPLNFNMYETFELSIDKITISTKCEIREREKSIYDK